MLRSLRTDKGRRETGLFLVEGARLCAELPPAMAELAVATEEARNNPAARAALERLAAAGVSVLEAPAHDIERMSDTVQSQGIMAAARWRDVAPEDLGLGESARIVALDAVSDPGNVGTVVRTAAWFAAGALLLGRQCADLLNPKTVRATMGGLFHLPVCRDVPLAEALPRWKARGFELVAATMDGSPDWGAWARAPRSILLLGSEAHGIAPELLALADRRVTIPRLGSGDSLNVAVSAGILLACAAGR